MANNYAIMTGAKLEYATITGSTVGTYTQIFGLNNIPDIGSEPDRVEATTFDDTVYRSYVPGLQDTDTVTFGFNLALPNSSANIKIVYDLANTGLQYSWRITYASGITVVFVSKCFYSLTGGAPNDLTQFNLNLVPEGGYTITVPSTSV